MENLDEENISLENIRLWLRNAALGLAVLVGLLSWKSGVSVFWLVVRAALSFAAFYLMCIGLVNLFQKMALPVGESEDETQGILLDVTVGDAATETEPETATEAERVEDKTESAAGTGLYAAPGQVKSKLMAGLPDPEQQAEIVRRMGWGDDDGGEQ
ncbi:MAG: hypothetical protein LBT22_02520 [Peptococcaceae bacterium]|jgi:hypothetical protein|nr:hypothetical protein [Peptococcaceae bacterium]